MKQPHHNPQLPDIADNLELAKTELQKQFDQHGVINFGPHEFGLLWRPGWNGPPQQLPEDTFPLVRLAILLEWIRADIGIPLSPGSTFRPLAYNTADGQSSGSQHLWARASDVRPTPKNNTSKNRRKLYDTIKRNLPKYRTRLAELFCVPESSIKFGLKIYAGFVHIDCSFAGELGARTRDWLPKPEY